MSSDTIRIDRSNPTRIDLVIGNSRGTMTAEQAIRIGSEIMQAGQQIQFAQKMAEPVKGDPE